MDYSDALTEKQWLRVSSRCGVVSVSDVLVLCILNVFLHFFLLQWLLVIIQFCVNFCFLKFIVGPVSLLLLLIELFFLCFLVLVSAVRYVLCHACDMCMI